MKNPTLTKLNDEKIEDKNPTAPELDSTKRISKK